MRYNEAATQQMQSIEDTRLHGNKGAHPVRFACKKAYREATATMSSLSACSAPLSSATTTTKGWLCALGVRVRVRIRVRVDRKQYLH